jgi:hypothetical protein
MILPSRMQQMTQQLVAPKATLLRGSRRGLARDDLAFSLLGFSLR